MNAARKHYGNGGSARIPHTLPALVFAAYKLVLSYKANQSEVNHQTPEIIRSLVSHQIFLLVVKDEKWLKKAERIFQFTLQTVNALAKEVPVVALKLFLQGALTADQVGNETITYEFFSQVGVAVWKGMWSYAGNFVLLGLQFI